MKDSIRRLRELRETLCAQKGGWQDAYAARDRIVIDLLDIYKTCIDKRSRKKQIEKKLLSIFEYLQVDPHEVECE